MRIVALDLYRYRLRLARPVRLKGEEHAERKGIIIRLTDNEDRIAWGETAPLPGFSRENLAIAHEQLIQLRATVIDQEIPPEVEKLDGAFGVWLDNLNLMPSVRFGFESATLNLIAQSRNLPFCKLLNPDCLQSVKVNVLLAGRIDEVAERAAALRKEGYDTFKLKLAGHSVDDAIELVRITHEAIGPDATLRLDANRAFDIKDAYFIMDAVAAYGIDYIEEPVLNRNQLIMLAQVSSLPVPVALDESLLEIVSDDLLSMKFVRVIILKPTLLGLEQTMSFVRAAQLPKITPVISSSFESSVGVAALAGVASAIGRADVAVGLDTLGWFAEDILEAPLPISSGQFDPVAVAEAGQRVDLDRLEKI